MKAAMPKGIAAAMRRFAACHGPSCWLLEFGYSSGREGCGSSCHVAPSVRTARTHAQAAATAARWSPRRV